MKKNYQKLSRDWRRKANPGDFEYCAEKFACVNARRVRTFGEIRQNVNDAIDSRFGEVPDPRPRGRGRGTLCAWNDFRVSRSGGKSWKDYTRYAKQWMISQDAAPVPRYFEPYRYSDPATFTVLDPADFFL